MVTSTCRIGSRTAIVQDSDDFAAVARLLKNADLRVGDFERLIDEAEKSDFVFADPPYTVQHNNNGFVKYNESLFRWSDQERLADTLKRASERGQGHGNERGPFHRCRVVCTTWIRCLLGRTE